MKIKKTIILSLILLSTFGCKNKNELILATEAVFAPYEYYSNDEIVGVDIEIGKEIAKEMGKELVVKDIAFDSIITEIKTGKSDIGAAGISYSEERAKQVDFTESYAESKQVIVVKNNSNITSPSDLKNVKVAVQLGSVADTYLQENYKTVELVREKKFIAAIQDLKDGKVDAVVMDELPAKRYISSDLKILDKEVIKDTYCIAIKKGNKELLNAANRVIRRMKESNIIDELIIKHMEA